MPVSRKCDEPSCRKRYVAKRADSRFCSSSCRQRAARAGKLEAVPDLPVEDVVEPAGEVADDSLRTRREGPVEASTRAELEEADRIDTALGQAALTLARRLDAWTSLDTGSSLGSLATSLANLIDKATKGAAAGADDPVRELQRKREERRRRA